MFKCVDITTNEQVISLDDQGPAWQEQLRLKGQADGLRCPTCRESVSFRAGELRRPHFAHKTLANCPIQHESPDLLEARAVLYQWLRSKFGEGVTLEKQVEQAPRSFDCWAEFKGKTFGYWLIERRIAQQDVASIENAAAKSGARLIWVFLSKILRRSEQNKRLILLSTTERACLTASDFDLIYGGRGRGTLHYLDADQQMLTSFRGCCCKHQPQVHQGHEIQTPMKSLLVSPATGEFVHPGEHGRLAEFRQRLKTEQERQRKLEEEEQRRWDKMLHKPQVAPVARTPAPLASPPMPMPSKPTPVDETPVEDKPPYSQGRKGVCEHCGQVTSDWWMFDGTTGKCRCNDCLRHRDQASDSGH